MADQCMKVSEGQELVANFQFSRKNPCAFRSGLLSLPSFPKTGAVLKQINECCRHRHRRKPLPHRRGKSFAKSEIGVDAFGVNLHGFEFFSMDFMGVAKAALFLGFYRNLKNFPERP